MKKTTVKLSGHSRDRFLERFFAEEPGLAPEAAERLAARSKATFTSLRVRRSAVAALRRRAKAEAVATAPVTAPVSAVQREAPQVVSPAPTAILPTPATPLERSEPPAPAVPAPPSDAGQQSGTTAAFDPYAFGLVPVFQREGRDGLIAKLDGVARADQLRQMAKAQQIVLPQELRTGEIEPAVLRAAIADAVAKRIANRRAAAG